jgi:hypothetical protein
MTRTNFQAPVSLLHTFVIRARGVQMLRPVLVLREEAVDSVDSCFDGTESRRSIDH